MSKTTPDEIRRAVEGQTVVGMFARTVEERADQISLRTRDDAGGFTELTWAQYADRACRFASALRELGVRRGDCVVLMLPNCPEFHVADLGCLLAGATPVSIYNSSAPAQIEYLAGHCRATLAVIHADFFAAFDTAWKQLPAVRHVVLVGVSGQTAERVVDFEDLRSRQPVDLDAACSAAKPDDLATVIYTSGTTGRPKGVMIRHRNICASLESWCRALGEPMTGWDFISYMPMAHVAERTLFSHYMHVREGSVVTTCPSPALLNDYLLAVRPRFVYCPPRLLEKMRAAIHESGGGELREALDAGLERTRRRLAGAAVDEQLAERVAAAEPVLDRVRENLGLNHCQVLLTGAAPIAPEVFDFFLALGLPLSECYGLSECTGGATWSPRRPRRGTVGAAVPGVEIRLLDDGEVLLRGVNVVCGYLHDPEQSAEAVDSEGWLHTGDIGTLDPDGYLTIVDRKKDIIITSGGQNVAPSLIEGALKRDPLIGQVCVIGEGRRFLSALIVLDNAAATGWAQVRGLEPNADLPLHRHPELRAAVQRAVEEVNSSLARVEQIKTFALLAEEWLPDSDLLTPTMKLKRRAVAAKFHDQIEKLYSVHL